MANINVVIETNEDLDVVRIPEGDLASLEAQCMRSVSMGRALDVRVIGETVEINPHGTAKWVKVYKKY